MLALGWETFGFAAVKAERKTEFLHRMWQTEEGLPNPVVRSVMQSKQGYLWLGTDECLARFDGLSFTSFDRKDFRRKSDRWVLGLIEASDGSIWSSGCNGGIVRIQAGRETFYGMKDGLPDKQVLSICEDQSHNLWVGTSKGVARFENGHFISYTNQPGLIVEATRSILCDRDGVVWFGTAKGLSRYKDGVFSSFTTTNLLHENSIMTLYQSRDGTLWMGTPNGLSRLQGGKLKHFTTSHGLAHNTVRAICEDSSGDIWIGSHGGLQRFSGGHFYPISYREAFSLETVDGVTDVVYSITEDAERNIWVGTSVGLRRFRAQKFKILARESGLPHEQTTSVLEAQDGAIWIGTFGGGVARLKDDSIQTFNTDDGLPSNYILSLYESADGTIWIGTDLYGMVKYHDGKFENFRANGNPENVIRAMFEDRSGHFWVLNNAGVSEFVNGRLKLNSKLTISATRSIIEDVHGNLWVGCKGGLLRYGGGERTLFTETNGLSSDWVNTVYEDREGVLWIGTEVGGLNRLKDGKFTSFGEAAGFRDRILHIVEDNYDRLWLATKNGVFTISKREVNEYLDGKATYVNVVSYGKADGMRRAQCNGIGQPAGCKSRDGRLWFPTLYGVAVFDTAAVAVTRTPPPVVIEEVVVNTKVVPAGENLELPPGHNDVEFHYTALTFAAAERTHFKYKLDGIDKDWQDGGTRRSARYSNLSPGKQYRFQVIAANADGVWNDEGATFSFTIEPHFYETAWFYFLIGLAILLSGTGVSRLRLRRLQQREQELVVLVSERTKELRQEITDRKQAQNRTTVFSRLGHRLSLANSLQEAARVIVDAADELIGWDACAILSYDADRDHAYTLASFDVIDGRKVEVNEPANSQISSAARRTIKYGPQLILREEARTQGDFRPFGDTGRPSASLMYVPIRHRQKIVGLVTIQSYRKNSYTDGDLHTLQALADYCAGAFERIRAEAALRESRQMVLRQERLAAVGQLAAGVAHEFNNILTVIKGHATLLSETEAANDVAQSINQVMTSADRAANLTRQMLAFSRKQLMQPRSLDLNDVIRQVVKMVGRLIGENISVETSLQQKLPPVHADPGMLEQIIMNLALNARDAMPDGGRLLIETAQVELREEDLASRAEAYVGNFIRLSVSDTGCGMDQATQQRIFEPFFTTKEVGKGTGLGLSTVYGIVKQHNGWIEVESEKGRGTALHIFLPFNPKAVANSTGPLPALSIRGGSETILFVEDEEDIRKLARQILEGFGYRVIEAGTGVEALRIWESRKAEIDLLFTDMVMPEGISGGQLARRLLQERPDLKVIYTSGYSKEILEKDLTADHDFKFLEKPYRPQHLAQIVREVLDSVKGGQS